MTVKLNHTIVHARDKRACRAAGAMQQHFCSGRHLVSAACAA
jgi:hypothetical protein